MKVGIMQPYFFPYIGYWQLMNAVDKYVIFDDVNYINRGWINRNRILVNGEPVFFNLPIVKASQNKLIKDIEVSPDLKIRNKNMKTIELAYKRAPYFSYVFPIISDIIYNPESCLSLFLEESFVRICDYLKITTEIIRSSELEKNNELHGQEKILDICCHLGATEYYNAIGGKELYSYDTFEAKGIQLRFFRTDVIEYMQFKNNFQPNLSILDVMMFNSPEEIKKMLSEYTLE